MDNILELSEDSKTIVKVLDQKVEHITIPDGMAVIGKAASCDCYKLQSIKIPDSVTVIEKWAFKMCYNLQSINIPKGVTKIEDSTLG